MNGIQNPPTSPADTISTLDELDRLIDVMRRLRDPETGCPWDVKQTFETIAPYTIEEAYEVADAIARGDLTDIRDELGDLLLQVVFQSRIAEEAGQFDLGMVAKSIANKMVARHPHVFGTDEDRPTASRQKEIWEDIKAAERAKKGKAGVLDDVATGLPPMMRALKLQKRAARVGFDWPDFAQLVDKLNEEVAELQVEIAAEPQDKAKLSDEVGDLLFVAVNMARKLGIDPETALTDCNRKFEHRFNYIEQSLEKENKSIDDASLDEMETLWQEAKQQKPTK